MLTGIIGLLTGFIIGGFVVALVYEQKMKKGN